MPYIDQKELTSNINQSKKLLNPNADQASNYGAISSKISQVSAGIKENRLASNPAVKERAPKPIVVRNHGAFNRKKTQ